MLVLSKTFYDKEAQGIDYPKPNFDTPVNDVCVKAGGDPTKLIVLSSLH